MSSQILQAVKLYEQSDFMTSQTLQAQTLQVVRLYMHSDFMGRQT
jgi:hypothetical protein